MASKYCFLCRSVPRFMTLPPQRLYWTPILTVCRNERETRPSEAAPCFNWSLATGHFKVKGAHQGQVHQSKQLCHVEVLFVVLHEEAHGTVPACQNCSKLFAHKLSMLLCNSVASCQSSMQAPSGFGNATSQWLHAFGHSLLYSIKQLWVLLKQVIDLLLQPPVCF